MTIPSQQPDSPQSQNIIFEQNQTLKEINANLAEILQVQKALLKEQAHTQKQMDVILTKEQEICLTDIDIPTGRLVNFMIKWAIASIPAGIILAMIFGGIYLLITSLILIIGRI